MGSIGGLDVAYGANLQIVRTNVLYIPADTNDYTTTELKVAHNLANQRLPAAVRPDYTCVSTANAGTTGLASDLTDDVEQGLLKSITKVPVGLRQAGTFSSVSSNEYGGMNILAVLNAGATIIGSGAATASPDLFTEADSPAAADGDETTYAENLHSDVLTSHFDQANSTSGEAKHSNVNSLNLVDFVTDLGLTYNVANTTVDDLVDGSEAADTAGSTCATLMTKLAGSALISVISLCQVA